VLVAILAGSVGCGRRSEDTVGETGQITTEAALDISSHKDSENIQHQLEVLAKNAGQWRSTRDADINEGYNTIYYLISDLDQNGRLEVMGHEYLGLEEKEISLGCYEVDASGNGIVEVDTSQLGNSFVDDFDDGLYMAYYDPETREYHYVTETVGGDWSDTEYQKITALTLKQGKISKEENVDGTVYAGCEKLTVQIPCFYFYHNREDTTEEQMIHIMEKAYQGFSMGYPLGMQEMTVSGHKVMIPQYSTMQDVEKQERINQLIYDQVSQSLEHAFDLQDPKWDLEDVCISMKYTGWDRVSLLLMASGSRQGMAHAQSLCDTVNIDLEQECILSGKSILPEEYREEVEEDLIFGEYQEILSGKKMKYPVSFQGQDIKIYQTIDRIGLVIPTNVQAKPYLVYEVYVDMDQNRYTGYPSSIPYPDVDWDEYQYTLLAAEYQSLQDYMPILLGKTDFTWFSESSFLGGQEIEEQVSIYQFLEKYGEPIESYRDYRLANISISDVTQDGKSELVLHFSSFGGFYLILNREGEKFYGTDHTERCFLGLQENGVYRGSGGASYQGFYQLRFRGGKFIETLIGRRDGKKYYIGDRKVEEKKFWKWEEENTEKTVCQYAPEKLQDGSGEARQ
ncbi:MAG: hypothetical protein K2K70_04610, partial [Lachnospiraceae bacterium]|nr:hypothetical protein [Lachnospiraceae bacterium]